MMTSSQIPHFSGTTFIETTGMSANAKKNLKETVQQVQQSESGFRVKSNEFSCSIDHLTLLSEGMALKYPNTKDPVYRKCLELSDLVARGEQEGVHDFLVIRSRQKHRLAYTGANDFDRALLETLKDKKVPADWEKTASFTFGPLRQFDEEEAQQYCKDNLFVAKNLFMAENSSILSRTTSTVTRPVLTKPATQK